MNDWLLIKRKRRHIREIPLAPVLDLLTVVVFFLILSTSFTELTKQTLPPSSVNTVAFDSGKTPLNPRLLAVQKLGAYDLTLIWSGEQPGRSERHVLTTDNHGLRRDASELVAQLLARFPSESSLQLGLSANMTYQELIDLMDGAREHVQDLVMISPNDAETQSLKPGP